MKNSPCISVLLPFYNAEKYLDKAIESILKQSYQDFELLLLDDGSFDMSLTIAQKYGEVDERISIISHANMGLCKTLQKGLSLAKGTYIARMDGDDIALPERFKEQIQYLEKHPNCVVLGTGSVIIDQNDQVLYVPEVAEGHNNLLAQLLKWTGPRICHPTVMMRTNAVKAVGGYVQQYHYEDIDLFLRLANVGQLENIPSLLLQHRVHLKSICHTRNDAELNKIKQKIYLDAVESLNLSSEFCQQNNIDCPQPIDTSEYYSTYEVYRRWSALAKRSGYQKSSLVYLWKAFLIKPFQAKTYWTAFCFLFGESYSTQLWNYLLRLKNFYSGSQSH